MRQAVWSLFEDASKTLVQAFVSCHLDYCNLLFFGISEGLMNRLQSVQNAAARLVTGTRRSDLISPVLRQLHWLLVCLRVDFKVATLVRQSLSGISPPYLTDDCHLVADARERRLRSTASRTCVVTRTYSTFADRAFGAASPGLWNSLLSHLNDADISYSEFRRSLKTFLFGQWGHGTVWTVLIAPTRNILTYLLTYLLTNNTVPLSQHIFLQYVYNGKWLIDISTHCVPRRCVHSLQPLPFVVWH